MRRLLICGLSVCFIFLLLIALIPSLANTEWGRKKLLHFTNQSIPGHLEVGSLHLSWFQGQILKDICLKSSKGEPLLEIESFSTEGSLFQLWRHEIDLGQTQIKNLKAIIKTNGQGGSNFQEALGLPPSFGAVNLLPSTLILSDVQLQYSLFAKNSPFSFLMQGKTNQDNLKGSFNTKILLDNLQEADWGNFSKELEKYLSLEKSQELALSAQFLHFPVSLIDQLVTLKYPHFNGLFSSLLGDQLNLVINKEHHLKNLIFNLEALSPFMQSAFKGEVTKDSIFLQEPATLTFQLQPEKINPFIDNYFKIEQKTNLKIFIENFSFPLDFLEAQNLLFSLLSFKGEFTFDPTFISFPNEEKIALSNFKASLNAPSNKKDFSIQLTAEAKQNQEPFTLKCDSTFDKPSSFEEGLKQLQETMSSSLTIKKIPLSFFPSLKLDLALLKEVGETADFQLFFQAKKSEDSLLSLALQTKHLVLNQAQFKLSKDVALLDPCFIEWTLSPAFFQTLLKIEDSPASFHLNSPVTFFIQLDQLHLPFHLKNDSEKKDPFQVKLDFHTSDLSWKELSQSLKLEGQLASKQLLDELQLNIDLISSTKAKLNIQTSVSQKLALDGSFNDLKKIPFSLKATMQDFSPPLLRALLFLDAQGEKKIQAVWGDSIQSELTAKINQLFGPLDFKIKGSNGSLEMKGELKEGILTLKSPLKGEFNLTPLLGSALFAKDVPFLDSLMDSEKPLFVFVEKENFSLPLIPLALDQIEIGKGMLDFGKVRFRNEGELHTLLQAIYPTADQQLIIWFTPLYFSLAHNQLAIQRLDLLMGQAFWLASWGKIDLNKHQMDMTVALSPQALKTAFGRELLNKDEMVQIPLRSWQGKIEVDQKLLTTKLASLLAQTQGGKAGQLLSSILNGAKSNLNKNYPSPTTIPFPWEKENRLKSSSSDTAPFEADPSKLDDSLEDPFSPEKRSSKKDKKKHKKKEHALQIINQFFK